MIHPKLTALRSTVLLILGNSIAQAIPIIASPIVTRLYSPEQFGVLSLFMAVCGILSCVSTLRYEIAIPQSTKTAEAVLIANLAILIGACFSLLLFMSGVLIKIFQLSWFNSISFWWIFLLPLAVFINSTNQVLFYYLIRSGSFQKINLARTYQGLCMVFVQLICHFFVSGYGLIIGYVTGLIVSIYKLMVGERISAIIYKNRSSLIRLLIIGRNYSSYPRYSVIGAVADSLSLQIPLIMVLNRYNHETAGHYGLTNRVLNVPIAMVASTISQVLYQKVSLLAVSAPEKLGKAVLSTFMFLVLAVIPFTFSIWFWGDVLFKSIFGNSWGEAGEFAKILIFAISIRFVVSPLSSVLMLKHNVRMASIWQITYLITVSATLVLVDRVPIRQYLVIYTIHEIVLYSAYLVLIFKGLSYQKG